MKTTITILSLISAIISKISWIWPLIEFCLYLFKDKPFNYFSLWFMLISWLTAVFFIITLYLITALQKPKRNFVSNKSEFQKRLEEMSKKNNHDNN